MRNLFDSITDRLKAFVGQRDHAALVVRCRDADGITVLKLLEGLDESSTSEMYWMYTGDFVETQSYVSEVVKDFAAKHEGVRLALEAQKKSPWPPIPPQVLDASVYPVQRLRELMIFSRSLLPDPDGCTVWALFPLQIGDAAGYARLIYELLQHQYPFPWFHHMRVILREDNAPPVLSAALSDLPRVDYYAPDLSDQAMENALEAEAADTELPLTERVQATFLSAQRDYAFGRFDEALKKHEVVLRYHSGIGNEPMVALVLNSVGEIHQRAGRADQASRCFESALEPACAGQHPPVPVLCNVLLNLANLRLEQQRFQEAEVYYGATENLATVLRNPGVKIQSIDNLGYCQYMQGNVGEALENWQRGANIADQLEQRDLQKSLLARLREHYAGANQTVEVRDIDRQLAALNHASVN
jgi:tetratricopeptide (TPR) repeat protein